MLAISKLNSYNQLQEDTTHNMSAGESHSISNNTGTENTMHSGHNDIDMDVD